MSTIRCLHTRFLLAIETGNLEVSLCSSLTTAPPSLAEAQLLFNRLKEKLKDTPEPFLFDIATLNQYFVFIQ